MHLSTHLLVTFSLLTLTTANPISSPTPSQSSSPTSNCRKTKVAILGAGVAGITAAQTLHNASITDFLILDANPYIGGRISHTQFGINPLTKKPYTVELGANWVQGLVSPSGPENPIWTLAKKWKLNNTYSDFDSVKTYDDTGEVEFPDALWKEFEDANTRVEQNAGDILRSDGQDRSMRSLLRSNGWKPKPTGDSWRQVVEWYDFDFEYAFPAEQSSGTWSVVNYNTTFYQFSPQNNFVHDQRGFSHFLLGEASTFLTSTTSSTTGRINITDPRVLLSRNVTKIDYSSPLSSAAKNGGLVKVFTEGGECVEAEHVLVTFSLGVLQAEVVEFKPALPEWKIEAIETMQMGTYTKIFLQFPPNSNGSFFWDEENEGTQFHLYADPEERGYYPLFQSLTGESFHPGSGILFVTVVGSQSYTVEAQDEEKTKGEILAVLKQMFGSQNVPEPIAFMYPRWSQENWARGSYSNWAVGLSLEMHQNLRADVTSQTTKNSNANAGKVWFAGEAGSVEFFGFLQGAYSEGSLAGAEIANCLKNKNKCKSRPRYETLKGYTTAPKQLISENGFLGGTFLTWGVEEE